MGVEEKYKEWRKDKTWDYETDHQLYEELSDVVSEIMYEDGPDRHTDGYNLIASYILENYEIEPKKYICYHCNGHGWNATFEDTTPYICPICHGAGFLKSKNLTLP